MTNERLADELEKALRDEVYDGGYGYMGDEQFTAYVRTLAVTAAQVAEASDARPEWPDHCTTNEKLRDLHARWHDQPGNLIEVCAWEGCEFWEAAKFTLRMADVRVIGREQGEPSDVRVIGREQGEPSDASVDAAIRAFHDATFGTPDDGYLTPERLAAMRDPWRAALRAASEAGGAR